MEITVVKPTAVPEAVLALAEKALEEAAPGATTILRLKDVDQDVVRRAIKQIDPHARVFHGKNDQDGLIRVRRYTDVEVQERLSRPPAKRKPRQKAGQKTGGK